jgi:hypothetical protein
LPEGWSQAANAISPWLFVAFLVGSAMPDMRWAMGAGVATLALAVVGYYGMVQVRFGYGGSTGALVLWSVASLAGGIVFGGAGRWWRDSRPWRRAVAIGLVGAVFIAEGVYLTRILPEVAVGIGFALVGLAAPLVLGRSWPDRARGYLAIVPAVGLGALGYLALNVFYAFTSGL